MKKLTLAIAAIVMGFMMASCGDSVKDQAIKIIDQYFKEAEDQLALIDNVEDFMTYAEIMSDRSDLLERLDEQVGEKTISDEDMKAVEDYSFERATAYNKAEAAKAAEFIAPALDNLEAVVNELYAKYQAGEALSADKVLEFNQAFGEVAVFSDYDNVLPELSERYDAIGVKIMEMNDAILPILDELFPDE